MHSWVYTHAHNKSSCACVGLLQWSGAGDNPKAVWFQLLSEALPIDDLGHISHAELVTMARQLFPLDDGADVRLLLAAVDSVRCMQCEVPAFVPLFPRIVTD